MENTQRQHLAATSPSSSNTNSNSNGDSDNSNSSGSINNICTLMLPHVARGPWPGERGIQGALGPPEGKPNWQPRADKLEVHLTLLAEKMLPLFHCTNGLEICLFLNINIYLVEGRRSHSIRYKGLRLLNSPTTLRQDECYVFKGKSYGTNA